MWELKEPEPVKLFCGILAADKQYLQQAKESLQRELGNTDLESDIWDFDKTEYYKDETGDNILRQFVSFEKPIDPGRLAEVKHKTNEIEKKLASLGGDLPRPVNLDPGVIETSKLVLATTKNYSHRVYIGERMYAEVTLTFHKGGWKPFDYTYPDYARQRYHKFFTDARNRLKEQLHSSGGSPNVPGK